MSKKIQIFIPALVIFVLAAFFGCAAVQDAVTPCWIPPASLKYADANATTMLPFTTLFDAKRVAMKMDFVHLRNQVLDDINYNFLTGLSSFHIGVAEEFQAKVFSPTGPIGLAFPTLGGGILGAFLLSKPSDRKKILDLEKEIKTNGKEKE